MFQTPQMREGSGIMAGVAPIRGYAEGDLVSDDFFTLEKTEEGSGMNLRDVTDFFFDPEDPVDYATIGLMAFPPAYVAARLARMGIKGQKAAEQVQKVVKAQDAIPKMLGGGSSRASTGLQVQLSALPSALMEEDVVEATESMPQMQNQQDQLPRQMSPQGIESLMPVKAEEQPSIMGGRSRAAQRKAEGGIASVQGYAVGGKVVEKGVEFVRNLFTRARKGEDVTKEVSDALQDGKIDVEDGDAIIQAQMDSFVPKVDLPGRAKKADEMAPVPGATDEVIEGGGGNIFSRNPITSGLLGATGLLAGYGAFGPDAETETPVMLDQSNLPPQPPVAPAVAQQQASPEEEVEEEVETQKPATGITKFLLGTDAKFGGDEEGQKGAIDFLRGAPADFLQNTISKLQDPEMRYALAKAAQPSEGFVPRNFLSDVAEGREEYRDKKAQREYLQAQTRDVDTTEIEKLTDFFMSTQDVSNATPEQILSLRNDIALSLNSMSKDQAAQELAAEMIKVYGSTPTGLAAVQQIIESMQTGDSLASVLEEFALERQDQ
tara:strand:- start:562 stop:2205 length:1644 start_codon:yes stop_codon:yes gene_type:complete